MSLRDWDLVQWLMVGWATAAVLALLLLAGFSFWMGGCLS